MKDISKRIKELRQQHGMTQEELAERVYVTRQAVSNWENKKTRPDLEMLESISNAFQIDMMELLYGPPALKVTKKQLLKIGLFAVGTVICLLLWVVILPIAEKAAKQNYTMSMLLFVHMCIRILSACFLPLLLSVISLKENIVIKSPQIRRICLVAGGVATVLFALYWVLLWGTILFGKTPNIFQSIFYTLTPIGTSQNITVLMGGVLYLGIKNPQPKQK